MAHTNTYIKIEKTDSYPKLYVRTLDTPKPGKEMLQLVRGDNTKRQWRTLIGIVIVGLTLTGCATIVNGQHQELAVTSQPEALCVSINGQSYGATPVTASLHRGHVYVVRVEQHGYPQYEISVVPVVSPWVWGNLVFGGLIGVVVDFSNDALYDLSPSRVHALFPVPQEQGHTMKSSECAVAEEILQERRKQLAKEIAPPSNLSKDSAIQPTQ